MINSSLIMVGLILAAPLLQNAWLCTDDGALHVYRTVALDRALSGGLLYPRWFPDLAYGYGFPFFNYREPLGYYLVEMVHWLGASFPLAFNLILAGSLIASGLTMNLWVSDIFDQPAGFVAAIVYMAAPYTVIDALTRGNLPEAIALALLPLILWAFRRLLLRGGRKYFVLAALSLAALLLTHNISSLIFVPVLLIYIVVLRMTSVKSTSLPPSTFRFTLLAFVLALALTAFFWLPALTEGQSAQLYLTHSARGNDYHFNLATAGEVFGPPGGSDPLLLNPPLRIVLGWAQIVLAVLGVVSIKRLAAREQRAHVIIAAVAAMIFIFMALPISLPVWDTLPLIRFVQFPWRFVGRAILPVAVLAGAAASVILRSTRLNRRWSRLAQYAALIVFTLPVLLSVTSLLYPRVCSGKLDLTINDVFAYEHDTGHIGVDPLGAYLPVTVVERPSGSPLEAPYAAGETIKRFDRSTLPAGAQVVSEAYRSNQAEIVIDTPTAFQATYLTFDFPGWRVTIDGQPIPIVPSDPNGLITFAVPAGQHTIEIVFEDTPSRTLANLVSLAALMALLGVVIRGVPRRMNATTDQGLRLHPSAFLLVPLLFLLLKLVFIDPQLTPLRQAQLMNGALPNVEHPLQVDFGDQLRLLGYRVTPGSAPSGETVRVDLYWRALHPLVNDYQTTVGLVDGNGEVWSPKTLNRPRDYQDYPPTSTWPPDAYTIDSFELPINPGTPPGAYQIFADVFERGSLRPLPAQASASRPSSRPWAALLGALTVTRAQRTASAEELGIYNAQIDQALAPEITLLGANRDRDEVLAGERVLLTLFWQAAQTPTSDLFATLELVDERSAVLVQQAVSLGGQHPTSQWQAGEQIIDLARVRVPPGAEAGTYHWRISIGNGQPIELGEVRVTAPDRSYEAPSIAQQIDQTLGKQVTLLGYDSAGCSSAKTECRVKLWWQAAADLPESYKVFVQLLDANGVPRAQADVLPQNGARPTWSWLPGEIIADEIAVPLPADLPAGTYRLTTGLYNELSGERLTLPDGADAIELTTVTLKDQ